jgi:CARDB protein
MRRVALVICLLALAPPAVAEAQAPPLRARLSACATGPQVGDRSAAFTASMPSVRGARRMAMRFTLQARVPPSLVFAPVDVPGLRVWKRSAVGRVGFIFTQRVQGLASPAAYRAVVRFRWFVRGHRLLHTARRVTAICRQPDWRPDLRAGALTLAPGPTPDTATYQLVVRNRGRGDAGAFDVALDVAGVRQALSRAGLGLPAGRPTTLELTAPRCAPGSVLTFVLDASGEIDESHEADDVVTRPCPAAR